jgi:hypothetical protein
MDSWAKTSESWAQYLTVGTLGNRVIVSMQQAHQRVNIRKVLSSYGFR